MIALAGAMIFDLLPWSDDKSKITTRKSAVA